jgi:hypothetical protein
MVNRRCTQLEQWCAGIPSCAVSCKGVRGALVSAGFRQIIEPIAESLSIPLSHVHANKPPFKDDGSADGFDANEFTSREKRYGGLQVPGSKSLVCHPRGDGRRRCNDRTAVPRFSSATAARSSRERQSSLTGWSPTIETMTDAL